MAYVLIDSTRNLGFVACCELLNDDAAFVKVEGGHNLDSQPLRNWRRLLKPAIHRKSSAKRWQTAAWVPSKECALVVHIVLEEFYRRMLFMAPFTELEETCSAARGHCMPCGADTPCTAAAPPAPMYLQLPHAVR